MSLIDYFNFSDDDKEKPEGKFLIRRVKVFLYFFIPLVVITIWNGVLFYLLMKDLSIVWDISFWIASLFFIFSFLFSNVLLSGKDHLIENRFIASIFFHLLFVSACISFIFVGTSAIWLKGLIAFWGAWKSKFLIVRIKNIFNFRSLEAKRKKEKLELEEKRKLQRASM